MSLKDITVIYMRNILKILERTKACEAEVTKYIVRFESIFVSGSHVGMYRFLFIMLYILSQE